MKAMVNSKLGLCGLGVWAVLFLSACGGGGSGSSGADDGQTGVDEPETGTMALALTDAEGDFLVYRVGVSAISMTRADGGEIHLLPATTELDFAQYVDVSELVSVGSVPAGLYTSVVFELDYSDAEIVVQGAGGQAIVADVFDGEGNTPTTLDVSLEFASDNGVLVTGGRTAQVTLDFDLEASHEITLEGESAEVVVEPLLMVDGAQINPKPLRARGRLVSVDEQAQSFVVDLFPFQIRSGEYGEAELTIDDCTHFVLDQTDTSGTDGLAALAALEVETPLLVSATWDAELEALVANAVLVDEALFDETTDLVRGVVLARDGDQVTMSASVVVNQDTYYYDRAVTVSLASIEQLAIREDQWRVGGVEAISVGSVLSTTGEIGLDGIMVAERAHVWRSALAGTVASVSPLAIELQHLSGHRPGAYDFTGTGTSSETDADPEHYEIATASLDLQDLSLGEPVRVKGWVSDFGSAPEDFTALSLLDASEINGSLSLGFGLLGSSNAITEVSESAVAVDLADLGLLRFVSRAGVLTNVTEVATEIVLEPKAETGFYAISDRRVIRVFDTFADFSAAVAEQTSQDAAVRRLEARGTFDDSQGTFSAFAIYLVIPEL